MALLFEPIHISSHIYLLWEPEKHSWSKGWEPITNSMQCMHSLPLYSNLGYIHLVGRCMLSLSQVLFHHPCFAIELDIYYFIKPINNRWAWVMVPEGGSSHKTLAEPIVQAIHDNLWAGTTRHCHTEYQWKLKYLPHTSHAKRDGQEKSGCKYVSPCVQAPATPHTDPWGETACQHCFMF